MQRDVTGKVVWITGAGTGIGAAAAVALDALGMRVALFRAAPAKVGRGGAAAMRAGADRAAGRGGPGCGVRRRGAHRSPSRADRHGGLERRHQRQAAQLARCFRRGLGARHPRVAPINAAIALMHSRPAFASMSLSDCRIESTPPASHRSTQRQKPRAPSKVKLPMPALMLAMPPAIRFDATSHARG